VAKYYPPLNSAQALQAGKVTTALRHGDHYVNVIAGTLKGKTSDTCDDVIFIEYSEKYLKGVMSSKINRAIKEILQVSSFNRWVKESIKKSEEILSTKSVDIVFTQSTPFDCHLVGLYLKKKYGVKWIAAFSDPYPVYISPYPYNQSPKVPIISSLQKKMLNKVLGSADKILVSSKEAYQLMCNYTHCEQENKYQIIPHVGLDIKSDISTQMNDGWLVYAGKITKERAITSLLLAVKSIKSTNKNFKGIKFIGHATPAYKDEVLKFGLSDCVLFMGEIAQSSIYDEIMNCSGLVLIEANMEYSPFLPSKFADYATLSKPILAIVPERSQVSDYLGIYGGGIVCGYDVVSITNGINQLIEGRITGSARLSSHFSISNVSRIYSEIFQCVIEEQ